jgi:hypothetical protein
MRKSISFSSPTLGLTDPLVMLSTRLLLPRSWLVSQFKCHKMKRRKTMTESTFS